MFQSRNRESFDFYGKEGLFRAVGTTFQSRNRESFDFYDVLIIALAIGLGMFQSRNRESFDFY